KAHSQFQLIFEHMVMPRAVYISNATELGTVYTRKELEDLRAICDEFQLYLIMDGARLGNALESGVDYDLNDLAGWCDA
ncbi:UNVERIFIED_CONTAM: beta-eliminating lyase-related protein, partial [Salmonella enterica subsp. enterica serovar Enteritidis]